MHEWATILWKIRKGFGDSGALFSLSATRLHLQLGIALAGVSDPSGCIEQLMQVEEILRQAVDDHPLDQEKTMKHAAKCPVCHADQKNNNYDREIVEMLGLAVEYFEDAKSDALEHNERLKDTLKSLQKMLELQRSRLGKSALLL